MPKLRITFAAASAAFLLVFAAGAPSGAASQTGSDAAVAFVNGKPVPKSEYDRALAAFTQQLSQVAKAQGGPAPSPEAIKDEVLKQLVNREVLYQASLKYPVKDAKQKVEEEFKKIQAGAPSPQALQEKLKASSMTEKDFKELISKQLSIRNYVEAQIVPAVKVTEADAKKFYEENKDKFKLPEQMKASHILIKVDANAKPADKEKALAKARELQKKAAKGEDFAKLARENSQDPGSAQNGGDLGHFPREQMVPPFAKAAFALKEGQVSDVVETQFGYHVIKAGGRKPASQQSFSDVRAKLTEYLKAKAVDEALTRKAEELRRAATITYVGAAQK